MQLPGNSVNLSDVWLSISCGQLGSVHVILGIAIFTGKQLFRVEGFTSIGVAENIRYTQRSKSVVRFCLNDPFSP